MDRINNVDVQFLQKVRNEFENDPARARKTQIIEGEWIFKDGGPQFQAEISYETGKMVLQSDQPTSLGGSGILPGPMHYCFFGLASCYTSTFAIMASMLGIKLDQLTCRVEAEVNFSKVFGLSEIPVMEEVQVTLSVKSDAPEEQIKQAEELALKRCPVVFSLTTPIKLKADLKIFE